RSRSRRARRWPTRSRISTSPTRSPAPRRPSSAARPRFSTAKPSRRRRNDPPSSFPRKRESRFFLLDPAPQRQRDPRLRGDDGDAVTAWMQSYVGEGWGWFLATLIFILLIALPLMLAVAMIIYADRKIWAAMALRRGPNVVGPFGLLQSFADGLKVFLKETIIPTSAN